MSNRTLQKLSYVHRKRKITNAQNGRQQDYCKQDALTHSQAHKVHKAHVWRHTQHAHRQFSSPSLQICNNACGTQSSARGKLGNRCMFGIHAGFTLLYHAHKTATGCISLSLAAPKLLNQHVCYPCSQITVIHFYRNK